ncbi:hypothetical protein F4703DRAFT_1787888 [Phycomyces blakesleeanus]
MEYLNCSKNKYFGDPFDRFLPKPRIPFDITLEPEKCFRYDYNYAFDDEFDTEVPEPDPHSPLPSLAQMTREDIVTKQYESFRKLYFNKRMSDEVARAYYMGCPSNITPERLRFLTAINRTFIGYAIKWPTTLQEFQDEMKAFRQSTVGDGHKGLRECAHRSAMYSVKEGFENAFKKWQYMFKRKYVFSQRTIGPIVTACCILNNLCQMFITPRETHEEMNQEYVINIHGDQTLMEWYTRINNEDGAALSFVNIGDGPNDAPFKAKTNRDEETSLIREGEIRRDQSVNPKLNLFIIPHSSHPVNLTCTIAMQPTYLCRNSVVSTRLIFTYVFLRITTLNVKTLPYGHSEALIFLLAMKIHDAQYLFDQQQTHIHGDIERSKNDTFDIYTMRRCLLDLRQ